MRFAGMHAFGTSAPGDVLLLAWTTGRYCRSRRGVSRFRGRAGTNENNAAGQWRWAINERQRGQQRTRGCGRRLRSDFYPAYPFRVDAGFLVCGKRC